MLGPASPELFSIPPVQLVRAAAAGRVGNCPSLAEEGSAELAGPLRAAVPVTALCFMLPPLFTLFKLEKNSRMLWSRLAACVWLGWGGETSSR